MKTFDHPNIVKIFDWFEDEDRIYMVMEWMQGGDLHERIDMFKRKRFEEEEIATIIQQVLTIVNYLH